MGAISSVTSGDDNKLSSRNVHEQEILLNGHQIHSGHKVIIIIGFIWYFFLHWEIDLRSQLGWTYKASKIENLLLLKIRLFFSAH